MKHPRNKTGLRKVGSDPTFQVVIRRPDRTRLDEEAAAVMAVQLATLQATLPGLPHPHTVEEDRAWMRGNCERLSVWLAVDGDNIVGVASRDGEWVRQLYVAPERTGQGIGQRLLDAMLLEAAAIRSQSSSSGRSSATPARAASTSATASSPSSSPTAAPTRKASRTCGTSGLLAGDLSRAGPGCSQMHRHEAPFPC